MKELRSSGFSLTELLVVVVIIGIMAGLSLVTFRRNWQDERVKAATRITAGWLEEVRHLAIQKTSSCHLTITHSSAVLAPSGSNPSACGSFPSLSLRSEIQGGSSLLICSQPLTGIDDNYAFSCSSTQAGTAEIVFTPRGTFSSPPSAAAGLLLKLHLPGGGSDRCIAVIAPLGLIRSGRANASGCDFSTAY